jgi:hypothetical protein
MGYLIDGVVLCACVGMYRVYTDRRKSRINTGLDSYQLLWLNLSRNAGDFVAAMSSETVVKYPQQSREFVDQFRSSFGITDEGFELIRQRILRRAARYRLWTGCKNLSYLQRVGRASVNGPATSIFGGSESSWKRNLLFASPTFLSYVKDQSTREYLHALSVVRDGFVGVIEGSSSEIQRLIGSVDSRKRDVIQDIRKGHVLDRLPESAVPVLHELRMDVEAFLFSTTGPDPDRSSFIEKSLTETGKSDAISRLSHLFPYLECIVDPIGDVVVPPDSPVPVFVPILLCGDSAVGVGKAVGTGPQLFVLDPLLFGGSLLFDGLSEVPTDATLGSKISLSLASNPDETIDVKLVEMLPQGVPVVSRI